MSFWTIFCKLFVRLLAKIKHTPRKLLYFVYRPDSKSSKGASESVKESFSFKNTSLDEQLLLLLSKIMPNFCWLAIWIWSIQSLLSQNYKFRRNLIMYYWQLYKLYNLLNFRFRCWIFSFICPRWFLCVKQRWPCFDAKPCIMLLWRYNLCYFSMGFGEHYWKEHDSWDWCCIDD